VKVLKCKPLLKPFFSEPSYPLRSQSRSIKTNVNSHKRCIFVIYIKNHHGTLTNSKTHIFKGPYWEGCRGMIGLSIQTWIQEKNASFFGPSGCSFCMSIHPYVPPQFCPTTGSAGRQNEHPYVMHHLNPLLRWGKRKPMTINAFASSLQSPHMQATRS
jgi:hypothetical protein